MPCLQVATVASGVPALSPSATFEDCLNACKEGACCEGTTCSIKPACQCQGTGKVFKGVGTVCSPNPCLCCCQFTSSGGSPVNVPPDACTSSGNRKPAKCEGISVTASVSGWVNAELAFDPGFENIFDTEANKDLSFANGLLSGQEVCGEFLSSKEGPSDSIPGGFWVLSSDISVNARFSLAEACGTANVRTGVSVFLRRVYRLGVSRLNYVLEYRGDNVSDCLSIEDLPASTSLLSGRSLTVSCQGSFFASPFFNWPVQPQDITVSFSSNPLP